eukprot:scaffold57085_cov46-Attheya_sp.AAC.4
MLALPSRWVIATGTGIEIDVTTVIENAVIAYKERPWPRLHDHDLPDSVELYKLEDVFGEAGFHSYWHKRLRAERFTRSGILYRPSITDGMEQRVEACFEARGSQGLMIKGPQGIGKSHSIVNLYRKLVTSGNYLVTFIPLCDDWEDLDDFVEAVCQSLGIEAHAIGLEPIGFKSRTDMSIVRGLLKLIRKVLKKHGLKWVFIFDQINSLFAKNQTATKLEELPEPYNLVSGVLESQLVTSVIAASANNEIAYKESHKRFDEFDHPSCLDNGELTVFVDNLEEDAATASEENKKILRDDQDMDEDDDDDDDENTGETEEIDRIEKLRQIAGAVPLYTFNYLKNPETFLNDTREDVEHSLSKLKVRPDWADVLNSIISSLLGIKSNSSRYDQKYFTRENEVVGYTYRALFPAISDACRVLVWEELMQYVEESEARLLAVCADPSTTNDTRGRIFENITIRRMRSKKNKVNLTDGVTFVIEKGSVQEVPVGGNNFPYLVPTATPTVIIPTNSNFPSVDWIWVHGSSIFGVKCHVNEHDDVFDKFVTNARKAKWFDEFDSVELLYFSPEKETADLVVNRVTPAAQVISLGRKLRGGASPRAVTIKRSAISISSLSSVSDLQWPANCSLPKQKKPRKI